MPSGNVIDAWVKYFRSVHGIRGRDYAVGWQSGGRKRLKRVAYVDLDNFLKVAAEDFRAYGQYLSIHDFSSRVVNGIQYHEDGGGEVPDALTHIYIDIEPMKDGVDGNATMETLRKLVTSVKDHLGAEPLILRTRPGRYGVIYVMPRVEVREPKSAQEVYRVLWGKLISIADLDGMLGVTIDPQVRDLARVTRVPYTYHEVTGKMVAPLTPKLEYIRARDFGMDLPKVPNDLISEVVKYVEESLKDLEEERLRLTEESLLRGELRRVTNPYGTRSKSLELPRDPAELDGHVAVPPCVRGMVINLKKHGELTAGSDRTAEHYSRLVLTWYLMWCGYSEDDVIELFRRYVKDFDEKVTAYQVRYAFRNKYLTPSCRWMAGENSVGVKLCAGCGWNRNVVTYTYVRASVPKEVREEFFKLVREAGGDAQNS